MFRKGTARAAFGLLLALSRQLPDAFPQLEIRVLKVLDRFSRLLLERRVSSSKISLLCQILRFQLGYLFNYKQIRYRLYPCEMMLLHHSQLSSLSKQRNRRRNTKTGFPYSREPYCGVRVTDVRRQNR